MAREEMGPLLLLLALSAAATSASEVAQAPESGAWTAGKSSGKRLRILSVMPYDAMSHHLWMSSLTTRLAELGHQVHSVDIKVPQNAPPTLNVTILEPPPKTKDSSIKNFMKSIIDGNAFFKTKFMSEFGIKMCRDALSSTPLQQLIDPNFEGRFDVVIIDHGSSDCLLGLIHRFNYPATILATPYPGLSPWMDSVMGNPPLSAIMPHIAAQFPRPMNLWQRLVTTLLYIYGDYLRVYDNEPRTHDMLKEAFGPSMPTVSELRDHVSLAFVNEVPVLEPARPYPPSIVPVGGMHTGPANLSNIPADLRQWMDSAPDGFIFMSFGSIMRSANLDNASRRSILDGLGLLKQRVLWKFETKEITSEGSVPPNVRTEPWLPQNDILGHPNIRLFISHCGGLSTQEAAYHGVPVLAVPHVIDQFLNAEKVERLGMGRKLLLSDFTKDNIKSEVEKLLGDKQYRESAARQSRLLRDQKEPPLERAVWWVEYVARHRGAPHLRSPALDLPLYQVMLLDVFAVLVLVVVAVVALLSLLSWLLLRCARWTCGSRKPRGSPKTNLKVTKKD